MGTGKNRPSVKEAVTEVARKRAAPATTRKPAPATTRKRAPAAAKKAAGTPRARRKAERLRAAGDAELFEPLTEGERADALRILLEDKRMANIAKIGRYRVIAVEPLVGKPPHPRHQNRQARIVAYDYASDRCIEAAIDLDALEVGHLQVSLAQPMLAPEEELAAIDTALADDRVKELLAFGDESVGAMHYWSDREADLSYRRRSAAVIFGQPGTRPTLVAVVDLLDNQVTEVVPADRW